MRKLYTVIIGIFLTFLFTACKQFTANIDDYLSYWAAEAFVTSASIEAAHQTDVTGIASVASEKDVAVTLKVQNPKAFKFIMPSASETRNIVGFTHFSGTKPAVGAEYEIKQLAADTLRLVYKTSFLKNAEWGEKNLSSTITLIADNGRVFKQTFTVPLKANTPPPKPSFTVVKTKGSPAYYVLCIMAPGMDKKVPGGLLHKDLARVEINETSYSFSVNEAQTAFTKPEGDVFITRPEVEKLTEPGADDVPAGGWALYYKTDVEVKDGAAKKDYTIKLTDAKGLVSPVLNASTKPNKAEAEIISITKGTKSSGSGSETDPVIIGTDSSGAELSVSSATANTTVHCTVSEIGGSTPVKYDGNPVTVPLPLNGASEKQYKLEYYTDGEGFAATAVKTVYYTIRERYTVTFDADGGTPVPDAQTVLHGGKVADPSASVSKTGFYLDGWYTEDAHTHKWDFNTGTVTSNMTLYANWIPGSGIAYKVEHYQQNINDDNYPASPTNTDNESGTTGTNAAVTLRNYPGFEPGTYTPATIASGGNTVVKVYYQRKQITVTFKLDGGKIDGNSSDVTRSGKYGTALTKPNDPIQDGYTFSNWQPTPPAPSLPSTFPAEDAEYTAQWDLNSYTVKFKVAGGEGSLYGKRKDTDMGLTSITTEKTFTDVPYGTRVEFAASPDTDWKVEGWTVSFGNFATGGSTDTAAVLNVTGDTTVTVKFYRSSIPTSSRWKDLLFAVKNAPQNGTITIKGYGAITATSAANDHGEIVIDKDLTIRGDSLSVSLDANNLSRIFKVKAGKTLTLEKIKLKNGKADEGGGVYNDGTLIMKGGSFISGCKAGKGGGVYNNGTLSMEKFTEVTPSAGIEQYTEGKNDVYLKNDKKITVNGTWTGSSPVARITPESYSKGVKVLTGDTVSYNYNNFTVTPDSETGMPWYIDADGNLNIDEVGVSNETELENAINGATTDKPRVITVKRSFDITKNFVIKYKQNITIKDDGTRRTLTCKEVVGGGGHNHFEVQSGGRLTFRGEITLKGKGSSFSHGFSQYVLFVNPSGTAEIADNVIITGFINTNSAAVYTNGTLIMSGGTIKSNQAEDGGGVCIGSGAFFKMTGGTIELNTAKYGGGVYMNNASTFEMTGGTITSNRANTNGKAVWVNGTFKWKGGTITGNNGAGAAVYIHGGSCSPKPATDAS